jgi:hypothetical protein
MASFRKFSLTADDADFADAGILNRALRSFPSHDVTNHSFDGLEVASFGNFPSI